MSAPNDIKSAAITALQVIDAIYEWHKRVDDAGGTACISGIAAAHAMHNSLTAQKPRIDKLIVKPLADAISAADIAATEADALRAEVERLREALKEVTECLDGEPEYHDEGMGCGVEDRNITDRYEAAAFGWEQAMGRVYSEHVNGALEAVRAALKEKKP